MANNLTAYIREVWAPEVQELAFKEMTALSMVKMVPMPDGDTYHRPYSSRVGTGSYTRNQTSAGVSATAITATDETLSVDTAKFASFEIDRLDEKQAMYNLQNDLKEDATYQLANLIDTAIFAEYGNAGSSVTGSDIAGGTAGQAVLLTTSNFLDVLEAAKAKLASQDVKNRGDWKLYVDEINYYKVIEKLMATSGYRNQDETLKNGYMGKILDTEIYITRNLSTSVVSNHNTKHWMLCAKGAVHFAMQQDAKLEVKDLPQNTDGTIRLSTLYILWNLYGKKTFVDGARKMVDINIRY